MLTVTDSICDVPALLLQVILKVVLLKSCPVKKLPPVILFAPDQPFIPPVALHEVGVLVGFQRIVVPLLLALRLELSTVRPTVGVIAAEAGGVTFITFTTALAVGFGPPAVEIQVIE